MRFLLSVWSESDVYKRIYLWIQERITFRQRSCMYSFFRSVGAAKYAYNCSWAHLREFPEKYNTQTNKNHGLLLLMSVPVLCFLLLTGCVNVKGTVRYATDTLMTVMTMTELNEGETEKQFNAVEESILYSCQPLFASAHSAFLGEDIPLLTKIEALFSSGGCRQTVDAVQRELHTYCQTHEEDRTSDRDPWCPNGNYFPRWARSEQTP
jgi:hypothetical protein